MKPHAYSYLRMSTDLQLKGDSKRRQLEASRRFASENGLELAEGAELEDIGVSAFKGANVRDGSLGRFLKAIESGLVKPGSYLLVESLDRLTRQELNKAQALFLSIIQAGINVVTLADNRMYRAGTNDLGDLIYSLVVMARAHEESQLKSQRIGAAWKNKRSRAAAGVPMTAWCPGWLKLSEDGSRYIEIPERAAVVRGIFEDSAGGLGILSIANRLNQANVPTFGSRNGWYASYVAKILANRAVLGESQPHCREDGKRIPDGDPNRAFFPAIIGEELFYRAQVAKSERKVSGSGRKGKNFTNLFSGLARCAYCKSRMKLENKGSGRKGTTYFICDRAWRRLGCPGKRWRYQDFEASYLAFVEEVDLERVLTESNGTAVNKVADEISGLKGALAETEKLMERTYEVLTQGGPVDFVTTKLKEQEARKTELKRRLEAAEKEAQRLTARREQQHRTRDELKHLVDRVRNGEDAHLYKLRAQVASHLKALTESLLVASIGEAPLVEERVRKFQELAGPAHEDIVSAMSAPSGFRDHRYFSVGLRDGKVRIVFPDRDDPLKFRQQITADGLWGIQSFSAEV
ncbi:recombinase family protein [Bradyrhizobium sp. LTSP857]|uniref:recombinase family protein n=1 Tax=Bradyrhizobium sp. LTSP857 TaxID=1619231 RepID=UPI0005D2A494|nr:recombinase family protein [Bradyrhizobium sp. LTSP857]